eukprot:scaffold42967_cov176-Amphora_coffeaeformis.AAC.4
MDLVQSMHEDGLGGPMFEMRKHTLEVGRVWQWHVDEVPCRKTVLSIWASLRSTSNPSMSCRRTTPRCNTNLFEKGLDRTQHTSVTIRILLSGVGRSSMSVPLAYVGIHKYKKYGKKDEFVP